VVYIYIGKQKVVWILKLRENGWEAAVSALREEMGERWLGECIVASLMKKCAEFY
jgi:hypothetical protein